MRGPEASSRVSIHSPPRAMFSWCRCAQSACSVMPGTRCALHRMHGCVRGRKGAAHSLDLIGGFDRARQLHDLLAVVHADAQRLERRDALAIAIVDRQPAIAAAMRPDQIRDLGGPARGMLGDPRAALEEIPAAARSHLVDQIEMRREMGAAVEVEHDHRAVGRDEGVAHRIVQAPDLHAGAVGGIADIDRIGDQDAGIVARGQLLAQARQAISAHRRHIRQLEAEGGPLARSRARPGPDRRTSRARRASPRRLRSSRRSGPVIALPRPGAGPESDQCAMITGIFALARIWLVAPPKIIWRRRLWV